MLINSLKTNTNPIHIKNHQTAGKTVNKSPQTVPIKNSALYIPKPNELCSKFNISFRSIKSLNKNADEDKNLDEFCLRLENKIKEMTTPKDPEIASWAMTPKYLDLINRVFVEDKIRAIYYTGISSNAMLDYLSEKEQLWLTGKNFAFIIDRMSLDYLKGKDIDSFLSKKNTRNVKFYCLDTNKKETDELIKEFNKLTHNSFEVKRIKRPENSSFSNPLDAKKIKAIIQGYAHVRFETDKKRKQFIDIITRYLDDNFLVFSYATLCEKLKEMYKKIEEEVKAQGKTMDDVIYLIPESKKSYDIVNYLYAKTNNVPQRQFKECLASAEAQNNDESKIYVILDDLCASGMSANSDIYFTKNYGNLLLAPVVACKKGIEKVGNTLRENNIKNRKMIFDIPYNDLGYIHDKLKNEEHFTFKPKYEDEIKNYMEQFKNLKIDDVEFLFEYIESGCGHMHAFISFPYMIPDNSSEPNAFFGPCFLNNDTDEANKATYGSGDIVLTGEDYEKVRKEIAKRYYHYY